MFSHTKSFFCSHFFSLKYFVHKKEEKKRKVGKERKEGNNGQIKAIGHGGKTGSVTKVPNIFK